MSRRRNRSINELQRVWDRKLKKSGFKDIEDRRQYFTDHKTLYDLRLRKNFSSSDAYEATLNYFQKARTVATLVDLGDKELNRIWLYHSEGLTFAEIGKRLNLNKQQVYRRMLRIKRTLIEILEPERLHSGRNSSVIRST